ncbi:MAG TPA: hypothetical protein VNQ76_22585 [Planctomicrobium sp.]|nr:hypothetical protein [Planctomicrobium sp.]
MFETTTDGIRFIEGIPERCEIIAPVEVRINGIITSAQLKNLNDVKKLMAVKAKSQGGNAIVEFKYGQRSAGFFASILYRDDVSWYGSGQIANIT